MAGPIDDAAARKQLLDHITLECKWRWVHVYLPMTPTPRDDEAVKMAKARQCLLQLQQWAQDPVQFIMEACWSPDPRGLFGGGKIQAELAPPRMVPIVLWPAQEELVKTLHRVVEEDRELHFNLLKSRQVAATTIVLAFFIWCWLFRPGCKAVVGSLSEDAIDGGGKGHREGDSLFARFRMMLDAIVWCLPHLAFNQHRQERWKAEQRARDNIALMGESDDTKMRLVRPRWVVFKREIFKDARGNLVGGKLPSDKWARSDSFTLALLDEFGDYDKLGAGVDKSTRESAVPCVSHIITQGTIPEGGGLDSEFKRLCDRGQTLTLINMEIDWSDVGHYMIGAFWLCEKCRKANSWGKPSPGPGPKGATRNCEFCHHQQLVTRRTITSPYFERVKDLLNYDEIALARYYHRDWYASIGDRAFYTFDKDRALRSRGATVNPHEMWRTIDGFDPGWSEKNPAAWVLVRFSETLQIPRIVAWHMAANRRIDWWIPFLKRVHPSRLFSTTHPYILLYGADAGRPWKDVHDLRPQEIALLEHIARIPPGDYEGDKYGSHKTAVGESEYHILDRYGINMRWEYTGDRGDLIGKARDLWVPRLEIDPVMADHRPVDPHGKQYPSILDCFLTARMVDTKSGQGQTKKDINKNEPWAVSHPIDAFLYACRSLPNEVRATMGPAGSFVVTPQRETAPIIFGETFDGQFGNR